jgi:hypothetical protein
MGEYQSQARLAAGLAGWLGFAVVPLRWQDTLHRLVPRGDEFGSRE